MNNDPRQFARRHQAKREETRFAWHQPVAAMLRGDRRNEVVEYARTQVQKWRNYQLCSYDYIKAWEQLLDDPLRAAAILEERSPLAQRLRQNTPFALGKFAADQAFDRIQRIF
jgi:hypothetical protein